MGRYKKTEWIFREVKNLQIFNEYNRIVAKYIARVRRGSPFIFPPNDGTVLSAHNAKMAAVLYYLRYVENWPPKKFYDKLGMSTTRIREITTEYPWYPGMPDCG